MSSSKILDVKYFEDSSVSIKYMLTTSPSGITHNSPHFYLSNEKRNECCLNIAYKGNTISNVFEVKLSLDFLNSESFNTNILEFEVIISLNNAQNGHVFKLTKDSVANTYKSLSHLIYEYAFASTKKIPVYVKIFYGKEFGNYKLHFDSFENLLSSEEHSDLTLQVANKTFNVHKCIISVRCNVLKKMIETDMVEKKTGIVVLSSWDPIVVKEVLAYIYTDKCEIAKVPHELFKLAHFLELKELELKCNEYLLKNVNLKNIISTLELVDMEQYELNELKKVANNFISANEATLVNDLEFQDYLISNIQANNIQFVLKIAKTHNLTEILHHAMEFISINYKEVLKDDKCKIFLLSQPNLLLNIYEYSVDLYSTQLKKLKNNNEESE